MIYKWLNISGLTGLLLFSQTAFASIDLKSWQNYPQLAEQGAICASFSALMESQSLLNEDMGRLWQERRKFAGAVIDRAVWMETGENASAEEIDLFIAEYRDWVLAALMTPDSDMVTSKADNHLALGQEKISSLIKTQCAMLFKQGDAQITHKYPELSYLISAESTENHPVQTNKVPQDKQAASSLVQDTKDTPEINLAEPNKQPNKVKPEKTIELALGGGIRFSARLPAASGNSVEQKTSEAPASSPQEHSEITDADKLLSLSSDAKQPVKTALQEPPQAPPSRPKKQHQKADTQKLDKISPTQVQKNSATPAGRTPTLQTSPKPVLVKQPVLSPAQKAATALIIPTQMSMPDISVSDLYVTFGDFADRKKAEQKKTFLEQRFATLFSKYGLMITSHTAPEQATAYRLQTRQPLARLRAREICTLLWPHQIGCVVKAVHNG